MSTKEQCGVMGFPGWKDICCLYSLEPTLPYPSDLSFPIRTVEEGSGMQLWHLRSLQLTHGGCPGPDALDHLGGEPKGAVKAILYVQRTQLVSPLGSWPVLLLVIHSFSLLRWAL